MVFYKVLWWSPQVDNEFKEYKKNSNFKIVKIMRFMSKTRLIQLLLSIIVNDKFWRSQLDILNLSI